MCAVSSDTLPDSGIIGARVFLSNPTADGKPETYIGTVSFFPTASDAPVEFVLPLEAAVRSASVLKVTPIRQVGVKATTQKLIVTQANIVPVDNSAFR